MKNIILSINTVEPPLLKAVERLQKELGYSLRGIVLVDRNYADKPERASDLGDLFTEIVCDFYNPDELQRTIQPFVDDILTVTCRLEGAIPALRQAIPFLPYVETPTESSLLWSTEKTLMRDRLSNHDASLTPRYTYLEASDLSDINNMVADFNYPVIVKPSNLAKSLLVSECYNQDELVANLNEVFEIIGDIYAKERRRRKPLVLVEEMIQGDMYSTDAYVDSRGNVQCLPLVRVLTAHDVGLPGFYGFRIQSPVNIPQTEIDAAFAASAAAIKALHLRSTTTHIELFHTTDGWKIIEVGARIGGYREALYREAYGIEHFYNDLANRLNMPLDIPKEPIKHAAGLNIYATDEGYIESIDGLDEARKLSSSVFVEKHALVGDYAQFADRGGELIVDAMLSNVDPSQLESDVQQLLNLVHIQTSKSVNHSQSAFSLTRHHA